VASLSRQASLQGSLPRSPQILAGSTFPADAEGVNGDYFMLVNVQGTLSIYGPKTNNTWVNSSLNVIQNAAVPQITYLQYLGDNAGAGNIATPSPGTGKTGDLCFLYDINGNCCAIATNTNGVWTILITGFAQSPLNTFNNGGNPQYPPAPNA
jgi:hypothetical protein